MRVRFWQELSAVSGPDDDDLAVGSELAHFRVLEEIGSGGMGIVYRGEDIRLNRPVAIKVLPSRALADPERRERFVREARAASALNHPNIVTIYEIGSEAGVDFVAMELLEGRSLREVLRSGSLPTPVAVGHALQVARGLAAAHGKGIVHRDLKPENLFVRTDGDVKILDFGLAKLMRPEDDVETDVAASGAEPGTAPGTIVGTVGYMSPEQVRGERADWRSDIFSLGAVLYEMLTGRRAFRGDSRVETLNAILKDDPKGLGEPGFPPGLEHVVARCLEKDPEQRFQSVRDLASALQAAAEAPAATRAPVSGRQRKLTRHLGLAALALAIVTAAVVGLRERFGGPNGTEPIRSLAVLPLQNLSGDAEQEYLADGMTDALIGNLAKIGALRVISRTSAMRYKHTKASLPQIARELNVDAVVEGSVLRSGDRVRVNARLSHAPTDRSLWAEDYERDLHDVLALQRELAQAITQEIRVKLTRDEHARLASASTVDPEVYQAYLMGRYHQNKRTGSDLRKAVELFKEALGRDPTYAPAYAGLSSSYDVLGTVQIGRPPGDMRPLAAAAARKALELDDGLAEAHTALGNARLYDWDWTVAERHLKRAIQLSPSDASARVGFSRYLLCRGLTDEALAEARRAQETDPLWPAARRQVASVLLNGRRYAEAIEAYRSLLESEPSDAAAQWFLRVSYAEQSMFGEAIAAHERALSLSASPAYLGSLGGVHARSGRRAEALATLAQLTELSKRGYVTPAAFVLLYSGLGDKDRAFEWLERGAQERTNLMVFLGVYPPLDPLRSDPRFEALLRRIGLPS